MAAGLTVPGSVPVLGAGFGRTLPPGTLPLGAVLAGWLAAAMPGPVRWTVRVTLPAFSATWAVAEVKVNVPAASSSVIVPVPWPSATVALVGTPRLTANVSFPSVRASAQIGTVIVSLVSFAAKSSGPAGGT